MRAVILAGGKGRRLYPYTTILPKPLMPIGEMPILEVVIRQLEYYGIKNITLSVGHLANLIQAFFKNGEQFNVNIDYSIEDFPLGTAGPLKLVNNLQDTFIVMNGDILTTLNFEKLYEYHKKSGSIATISIYPREVKIDFGVIEYTGNLLTDYIEKPKYDFSVSMGIYVFEPDALKYIAKGEYLDINDLILNMKNNGEQVSCYREDCFWLDIGRKDDYEVAVRKFEEMKSEFLKNEK